MSEEVVKVIKIETAGGQQTVKGLREEIKSLRDDLVGVEKGTKEYDEIVSKLIDDEKQLTDVMRAGKNEVSAATGSYNALQNEMTSLRKVWKEVTTEAERNEIGVRIKEINDQLKDMDSSIGNNQRKVGSYEEALRKVTAEYTSQRSELKALRVELEQLEPGTDAYNQKFQRAAEITHNLAYQQEMLKYSSTDLGDQISNLRAIAGNMAAGFSAVNAAMGLFGSQNEDVAKALLKVQQAMALVQGLQGMDSFLKRTQGLSSAIKGWITQSKAATVQTQAQTVAQKANATATNAQTVATEGATVAQKGLNAAMKANPIGIILGLIALLIANWKKLTEWLGKAVGGWDKLNAAMNKFKTVAAGVANVIKKVLLVPIKEAITYVTTLGKVFGDIFKGDWKNIGADLKDGLSQSLEIIKDGYDIAGNYIEGKEKQITKQIEAENKKRTEARIKELDKAIELKEAQNDSDWKYTEEGRAMYEEYFANLERLYKDDAEKYHEYQVQKASYEKGLADYNKKVGEDARKRAEDARKKAADAAKKAQEELKKIEQDYQSKVASKVGSTYTASFDELKESLSAFSAYYKSVSDSLSGSTSKTLNRWSKEIDSFLNGSSEKIKVFANETASVMFGFSVKEIQSILNPNYFDTNFKDALGNLLPEEEIKKKWKSIVDSMTEVTEDGKVSSSFGEAIQMRMDVELQRIGKLSSAKLNDALENSSDEANRKINDEIIKIFQKNIKPTVDEQIADLQLEIGKKTIKLDFEIETGMDFNSFMGSGVLNPIEGFDKQSAEFQKAADIYENSLKQVNAQLDFYQKTIKHVNAHPELIPSDEYENALKMVEQLTNQAHQLYVDYYNTQAEIRDRYFAEDIQAIQAQGDSELREYTKMYNELYTKGNEYYNYRVTQTGLLPEHDIIAAQKSYEIQRDNLQKQLDAYKEYLNDVTVAGDQRVEAERIVAELIAEIEEGEVAHTIEMNQLRINAWTEYFDMVQDGINGIGNLFGGLASLYEADIKAKRDANEMSQDDYEKAFEGVKGIKIAEATMSMISGALGAFMQGIMSYPPPFGEILGGIGAAAALATGAAQIAQIKNQKPDGKGGSSDYSVTTPKISTFTPEIVENPTGNQETQNLRNAYMNQNIYVKVSDIEAAEKGTKVRVAESSF